MPSKEEEEVELRSNGNGLEELSRMTAEFESFVKNTQNEPRILLNGEAMNEEENLKVSESRNEVEKLKTKQIVEKPDIIQSIEMKNSSREVVKSSEKQENCFGGEKEKIKVDVDEKIILTSSGDVVEIQKLKILSENTVDEKSEIFEVKNPLGSSNVEIKETKKLNLIYGNENHVNNQIQEKEKPYEMISDGVQIQEIENSSGSNLKNKEVKNSSGSSLKIQESLPIKSSGNDLDQTDDKSQIQENVSSSNVNKEIQEKITTSNVNKEIKNSPEQIIIIPRNLQIQEEENMQQNNLKIQEENKSSEILMIQEPSLDPSIQIVEIKSKEIRPPEEHPAIFSKSKSESQEISDVPHLVITESKILKIDEEPKESSPPVEVITTEVHQLLTEIRSFPDVQHLTPTPTPSREVTPDYIPTTVREKFHVLRIDEEEDKNIKEVPMPEPRGAVRDRTPIPLARTEIDEKLQHQGYRKLSKTEFLAFDNPESVEIRRKDSTDELLIKESDDIQKNNERRRSVKEIIESINRQQQKLKINQPPTPQFERKFYYGENQKFSYHEKPAVPPKENVMLKLKRHEEHERRINELLDDLQGYTRANSSLQKTSKFPLTQHRDDNNNKFESDAINPIPKPRRAV